MAHQDDDPGRVGSGRAVAPRQLAAERRRLGLVDRHVRGRSPGRRDPGHDLADHRLAAPAPEVLERLLDGDPLGTLRGDPADPAECVVRPISGGADDRGHGRRSPGGAGRDPLGDVEDRGHARLVVGEVDDHDAGPEPEQVEPAR